MTVSATLTPSTFSSSSLGLKPVLGEGREERWSCVKQIMKDSITPLYGSQDHLLREIKERKNIKCRLLYENTQAVGLVIFNTDLSNQYKNEGFKDCFEIKLLYAEDQKDHAETNKLNSYLLDEMLEQAKTYKASSLAVRIASSLTEVPKVLEQKNFSPLKDQNSSYVLYAKKIKETSEENREIRKRAADGKEEKPSDESDSQTKRRRADSSSTYYSNSNSNSNSPSTSSRSHANWNEAQRYTPGSAPFFSPSRQQSLKTCTIQKKYLMMIKDGRKTIEGRINNGMFRNFRANERIKFFCGNENVICKITRISQYPSFAKMLENEGVAPCLPDVNSLQDAIRIYDNIPTFKERAAQFGVLAIHLQVVDS